MTRRIETPDLSILLKDIESGLSKTDIAFKYNLTNRVIMSRLKGIPTLKEAVKFKKYSPLQREIIDGSMLGDGYIMYQSPKGKRRNIFYFKEDHSIKQLEYLNWKYEILKEHTHNPPFRKQAIVRGKVHDMIVMETASNQYLVEVKNAFYNSDNKRVIPADLSQRLTKMSLSVLFGDNGYKSSPKSKGKGLYISTERYSKVDQEFLAEVMYKKFKISSNLQRKASSYALYIVSSDGSADRLREIIRECLPECMHYKLM